MASPSGLQSGLSSQPFVKWCLDKKRYLCDSWLCCRGYPGMEIFDDVGPSVVMASPSGLQSGPSRQLFYKSRSDKKNACVISGYVVEDTLAKTIINEAQRNHPHEWSEQTSDFLNEFRLPNIILLNGEANEMARLKWQLIAQFADKNTKIMSLKSCQSVEMCFTSQKMVRSNGRLAEKTPKIGAAVSGLLVKKGFTYQIMASDDLHVFSQLSTANIAQRIFIPYSGSFSAIKHRLKQIYESVEAPVEDPDVPT